MKQYFLFLLSFFLLSCNDKPTENEYIDDLDIKIKADSLLNVYQNDLFLKDANDSTGMKDSPIIIVQSKIVEKKHSNYRDLYIKFKNVSDKAIEGIKFEWYGTDVFGEPTDMGGYSDGYGKGFTDDKIKAKQIENVTYNISSKTAKKILMVRAYEVVFEDGTTWKLKQTK